MDRLAEEIFELAYLVPAQRETGEIIPLHVDHGPAQGIAQARRGFERGRPIPERYAWQPPERPAQVSNEHAFRHSPGYFGIDRAFLL